MKYKDIINFTLIKKLKNYLNDICIIYNNLVKKDNIKKRESEFYEVYTKQYQEDLQYIEQLRDKCLHTADLCNEILLMTNRHHIKQYYIDKEILDSYEFYDEYNKELEKPEPDVKPVKQEITDEEDFW
jgi:hypothetical protein